MTNNTLINFEMLHTPIFGYHLSIEKIRVVAAICGNITPFQNAYKTISGTRTIISKNVHIVF